MGCHRIGLGMNSVVKEASEMFENEEIGLNACKKIIMACKNGVYWCDGYESDVIAGMDDYCGNCLRKFSAEELIEVDRNKYFVVRNYICKSCYDHLVCDYVLNSRTFYLEIISTPSSVTRKVCSH